MKRLVRRLAAAVAVLLVAAASLHVYAYSQYRASFGDAPFAQRAAAARRAARIEPFDPAFRARPFWLRGEESLRRNRPADAYAALRRALEEDPGNDEVRRVHKRAYAEWVTASARKAHVQHGKEGTGGVLNDEDVQR